MDDDLYPKLPRVVLSKRDIKMLDAAVDHVLNDGEWEGCPHLETRVRLYVTSVYRLGSRLKYETAEGKILLAEPYLLGRAQEARLERIEDRLAELETWVGLGES